MQETTSRKRPLGVTILAAILGIEGIAELIIGIILIRGFFTIGHALTVHGHTIISRVVDTFGGVLGGASVIVGILTLIFALGLFALQRWAFWLTVVIEVITLLRYAVEFIPPYHPSVGAIVFGMIIPIVILIYFFLDPNVRAAFRI